MLTRRYPRYTGEYFVYSYALVFTNRFWTLIMSGMLMLYLKPKRSQSIVIYEFSFPSISNMLSSWCQYEALRYVSFPATTLFKSFKLAPVMAMGKILGNKSYPQYDYIVALMIGVGIAMFMTSTDDLRLGFDYLGQEISTAWTGIMLLVIFLFFDSFTSQFQSRMFQRHQDLSMVELMFMTSAFSAVLSFVTLLHTQELYPALNFVMVHSEIHLHFFLFSICSTIGQLLIFYTIKVSESKSHCGYRTICHHFCLPVLTDAFATFSLILVEFWCGSIYLDHDNTYFVEYCLIMYYVWPSSIGNRFLRFDVGIKCSAVSHP